MPDARGFLFETHRAGAMDYPYAVYVPRTLPDPGERGVPLIVFLHGRGECGTEGSRQLAQGLPRELIWNPQRWPAIVLLPQKPDYESQWIEHEHAVMAMLERVKQTWPIDASRVYLTGLSQGGAGTWDIAASNPDIFAAIAPVCGYVRAIFSPDEDKLRDRRITSESKAAKEIADAIGDTPVWIFHGADDTVVSPSHSEAMRGALKTVGNEARYSLYPGVGHDAWTPAYREEDLPDWLLSHTLER